MNSLQARLSTGLLISLLVIFFVLWLIVSNNIRQLSEGYIATRLAHDSETVLSALEFDSNGTPVVDITRIDAIYTRPFSGHYYKLQLNNSNIRSRSLWDQDLITPDLNSSEQNILHMTGPEQQPLLALTNSYTKQDHHVTILIAEDLTAIENEISDFQHHFTVTAATMLLLLVIINIFMVRTGFRPIRRVQEEIRALEKGELQQLDDNISLEIKPLATEINRLLQILNTRLLRSRNALGDLAHALKKPLTILRQAEQDKALDSHPDIRQTIESQTQSMQQIIDRVLRRARLAGEGPTGAHFNTSTDIPPLIDVLNKMHSNKKLQIITDIPPELSIAIDREDMLELLGNLLDNACKWARSRVRITLKLDTKLYIVIEDDGAGVHEQTISELSQRGKRLDESIEGHGLGLAISRDIVAGYGGVLDYGQSESLGGFQITITMNLDGNRLDN
jgi:signal transduction histidine kinase